MTTPRTQPLRIAFFIDAWNPGSGTENQLAGMLQHFDRTRVEPELFTLRHEIPDDLAARLDCPVNHIGVGSLVSVGAVRALGPLVNRLKAGRFDAAMIYFVDTNLYAVPACRLAGIQSVIINRRDMGYWYEDGLLRKLNAVNKLADYFLVNSGAVKHQVVAHEGFPAERIHVIVNGLWDAAARSVAQMPAELPGIPAEAPVVGITASLRPVKRIDRFLEMAGRVADRVPAAHFVIAGQGELEGELRNMVLGLGLAEKVHFLGQVADVPPLLARLQVGVLTSESEGLSNSLVEYGAAGLPTVTFDTGGNAEVVREGETGYLVPEGDVVALAGRVGDLLDDEARRRAMGDEAGRWCRTHFAPDAVMARTMTFFEGVAAAPRRGYHA